jgi:predicted nucleic acid-binding protein
VTVYLDSSSLVKVYVQEPGTDDVRQLLADASVATTSVVAYAEVRAALARQRRTRALTPRGFTEAKRLFEQDWPMFVAVEANAALCRAAGTLAERYALRGFDAIHLASFQQVLERATDDDVEFSSADDRLTRAARRLK